MTEDDTFRILSRISYKEMEDKYHKLDDVVWNRMTEEEAAAFFGKYGWTEYEFRCHP